MTDSSSMYRRERAVAQYSARDVVEPEALTEIMQLLSRVHNGSSCKPLAAPSPTNAERSYPRRSPIRSTDRSAGGNDARIARIGCVVSLAREHRRQSILPDRFHHRQYAQLVIDHDVVPSRKLVGHGIEHLFLVDINQHAPVHGAPQSGALDLARLEHHIAVGEDDGESEAAQMANDIEGVRIETLGEGIVHEKRRHRAAAESSRTCRTR